MVSFACSKCGNAVIDPTFDPSGDISLPVCGHCGIPMSLQSPSNKESIWGSNPEESPVREDPEELFLDDGSNG